MNRVCANGWIALAGWVGLIVPMHAATRETHVIRVANPTGIRATDRAHILESLRGARPGDTVQFAHGRYLVGPIIKVATQHLTLIGDPRGTVLRGCNPDVYSTMAHTELKLVERVIHSHATRGDRARLQKIVNRCGMFQLTGGNDVVRHLTFEYMRLGLVLGYRPQQAYRPAGGGDVIEDNTFRTTNNGIRAGLSSSEPTLIRGNLFVDVFHAVILGGSHVHVEHNTILAPAPSRVPGHGYPSLAIGIDAIPVATKGSPKPPQGNCYRNIVADNVIVGYPSGIEIGARPGTICAENIIRGNTIAVARIHLLPASPDLPLWPPSKRSTAIVSGTPILLNALGRGVKVQGRLDGNRISHNRIEGAVGFGIRIEHASDTWVVGNTIEGIRAHRMAKSSVTHAGSEKSSPAGAGIWVAPGSDGNRIQDNVFRAMDTSDIVLGGDRNFVRLHHAGDSVQDSGTGNRIEKGGGGN